MQANKPSIGTFVFSSDAATTEIAARAGFDLVICDLEHAPLGMADVVNHARAAQAFGASCWARIGSHAVGEIGRVLDTGVQGVVLPHFGRDLAASREALSMFRFPPAGTRGTCSVVRGLRYKMDDPARELEAANARVLSVGLIEDKEAVDRIDEVVALPGLDAVMPGGPGDLAASLGLHGQGDHPAVQQAALRVVQAARRRPGLKVGVYLGNASSMDFWRDIPLDFYAISIDYRILEQGFSSTHAAVLNRIAR